MPADIAPELALDPRAPAAPVRPSEVLLRQLSAPLQGPWPPIPLRRTLVDILVVLAIALALRLPYFRWRMFPLNDGGMFAQMIDDIRLAHFHLPLYTSYNFLHIPFSYPPLAFYLGALCTLLPGQSTVTVLTWLPLCLSLGVAVAVYFVAREIYPSPFHACLAAICYVAIGRSSEWLMMGGGLTRAPGALFAVVAILLFLRAWKRQSMRLAAWSGFWTGLACLFHLEGGMFAAFSLTVLAALLPSRRLNLHRLVAAGVVSIVVVLPWVLWLYTHLGFGPLLNASRTGDPFGSGFGVPTLIFLATATILALVARFPYLCWLSVLPLVMRRSASTYGAIIGGLCMVWFANALLVVIFRSREPGSRWRPAVLAVLAVILAVCLNGVPRVHADHLEDLKKNSRAQLSPLELQGMRAAAQITPPGARFFVFNQRFGSWPSDMVAEWFPYFAQRPCVNTVQGTEWLPNLAFYAARKREDNLELAGSERFALMMVAGMKPDYIFLAGPLDTEQNWLAAIFRKYANSAPIYQNAEVTIYRVNRPQP
ncbi:MAG TPA: glycosyltransferase family 39 protein [Terriglobales bacterium]|nr:glycosyltransferase family 39 protein [Terriglobales bacterium]